MTNPHFYRTTRILLALTLLMTTAPTGGLARSLRIGETRHQTLGSTFTGQALVSSGCDFVAPFHSEPARRLYRAGTALRNSASRVAPLGVRHELRRRWLKALSEPRQSLQHVHFLADHHSESRGEYFSRAAGLAAIYAAMIILPIKTVGAFALLAAMPWPAQAMTAIVLMPVYNILAHGLYSSFCLPIEIIMDALTHTAAGHGWFRTAFWLDELAPAPLALRDREADADPDQFVWRYNRQKHRLLTKTERNELNTELDRQTRVLLELKKAYAKPGSAVALHYQIQQQTYQHLVVKILNREAYSLHTGQRLTLRGTGLPFEVQAAPAGSDMVTLKQVEKTGFGELIPGDGFLLTRSNAWGIDKQLEEIDNLRFHLLLRQRGLADVKTFPDRLLALADLAEPKEESAPREFMAEEPADYMEDAAQLEAVRLAMNGTQVLFIEGPAATGKTETLVRILRAAMRRGDTVIFTSQMHHAVDVLVQRIMNELPVVRLGNVNCFEKNPNDPTQNVDQVWLGNRQTGLRKDIWNSFEAKQAELAAKWGTCGRIYAATDMGLVGDYIFNEVLPKFVPEPKRKARIMVMDESSRETRSGAFVTFKHLADRADAKIILVGDTRQLAPHGLNSPEEAYLRKKNFGKSILDAFQFSIFDWLLQRGHGDRVMLQNSYRSVRKIARMVSDVFYDNKVRAVHRLEGDVDALLFKDIGADAPEGTYFDEEIEGFTEDLEGEPIREKSYINRRSVPEVLAMIRHYHKNKKVPLNEIMILTPYRAQVELLQEAIERELRPEYGENAVLPEVTTIKSIQGGQSKAVILDLVRSNPRGKFGFLDDPRQLNVGLSRGEEYVGVIGDRRTFSETPHPGDDVVDQNARKLFGKMRPHFEPAAADSAVPETPGTALELLPFPRLMAEHGAKIRLDLALAMQALRRASSIQEVIHCLESLTDAAAEPVAAAGLWSTLVQQLEGSGENDEDRLHRWLEPFPENEERARVEEGCRRFLTWWQTEWRDQTAAHVIDILHHVPVDADDTEWKQAVELYDRLPAASVRQAIPAALEAWGSNYLRRHTPSAEDFGVARLIVQDAATHVRHRLSLDNAWPPDLDDRLLEAAEKATDEGLGACFVGERIVVDAVEAWMKLGGISHIESMAADHFEHWGKAYVRRAGTSLIHLSAAMTTIESQAATLSPLLKNTSVLSRPMGEIRRLYHASFERGIEAVFEEESPNLSIFQFVTCVAYYDVIAKAWGVWSRRMVDSARGNRTALLAAQKEIAKSHRTLSQLPYAGTAFSLASEEIQKELDEALAGKVTPGVLRRQKQAVEAARIIQNLLIAVRQLETHPAMRRLASMEQPLEVSIAPEVQQVLTKENLSRDILLHHVEVLLNSTITAASKSTNRDDALPLWRQLSLVANTFQNYAVRWSTVATWRRRGHYRAEMNEVNICAALWNLALKQMTDEMQDAELLGDHALASGRIVGGTVRGKIPGQETDAPLQALIQEINLVANLLTDPFFGSGRDFYRALANELETVRQELAKGSSASFIAELAGQIGKLASWVFSERQVDWFHESSPSPSPSFSRHVALKDAGRAVLETFSVDLTGLNIDDYFGISTEPPSVISLKNSARNLRPHKTKGEAANITLTHVGNQAPAEKREVMICPPELSQKFLKHVLADLFYLHNHSLLRWNFQYLRPASKKKAVDSKALLNAPLGQLIDQVRTFRKNKTQVTTALFRDIMQDLDHLHSGAKTIYDIEWDRERLLMDQREESAKNIATLIYSLIDASAKSLVRVGWHTQLAFLEKIERVETESAPGQVHQKLGSLLGHSINIVEPMEREETSYVQSIEALRTLEASLHELAAATQKAAPSLEGSLIAAQTNLACQLKELLALETLPNFSNPFSIDSLFFDRLSNLISVQRINPWEIAPHEEQPQFPTLFKQMSDNTKDYFRAIGLPGINMDYFFGLTLELRRAPTLQEEHLLRQQA